MKISKLFHWLYAAVMMLPLFLFPIFALAVRSDNNFTPIEVQQEKVEVVNFNQLIEPIEYDYDNSHFDFVNFSFSNTHKYYIKQWYSRSISSGDVDCQLFFYHSIDNKYVYDVNQLGDFIFQRTSWVDGGNVTLTFRIYNGFAGAVTFKLNIFDLTLMFGTGNEPSIEQFDIWFSNDFYDYTLSDRELLHTGTFEIFNDTDIGSQMVYTAYRVVDNYFNYDNVFNFKDLYTWLETTYFSGSAPLGFFIFWHLLIYWLLTSLLWLLFDVLMYVPMLIHRWLDKAALS